MESSPLPARIGTAPNASPWPEPSGWQNVRPSWHLAPLRHSKWVVYAKPPFGGPERVLDYLGRYTHRVAISNHRLKELKHGQVTFAYKDYQHQGQQKEMTLPGMNSYGAFCCMSFQTASSASAITGC